MIIIHSQISILYPFDGIIISVDSGMQEILGSFWSIGIETFSSCENMNNKGLMSITFELDEYLKFLRLIDSYGLNAIDSKYFDICCRIRGQTQPCSILDAWHIMINAVGIPKSVIIPGVDSYNKSKTNRSADRRLNLYKKFNR